MLGIFWVKQGICKSVFMCRFYFFVHGLISLVTGIISILSLGFISTNWEFDWTFWFSKKMHEMSKKIESK